MLFVVFLLIFSARGFAQESRPWWFTLERGKRYFREGAYGNALIAFEDAISDRSARFTRLEQDLILLLSSAEARRLGDSLEFVERYIGERRENAAAAALAELFYRVPRESLNGSVNAALDRLGRLKAYPEAEYWLGETYRAEGELSLALRQYERAFEARELLETPEFDIEILYKITDIHRIRQNYQEMEKNALEIIEGQGPNGAPRDEFWVSSRNQMRAAMMRILENDGIDRFLTMYRHHNTAVERAHRLLGFFYYASSRYSPAVEQLMFAFLIQNSVVIDEIIRREYDFSFTSLENLMGFVNARPELAAFLDETEYYKTAYYLASALFATGKARPASQLWAFLAGSAASGEWGNRARRNPAPFLDRAIEMP